MLPDAEREIDAVLGRCVRDIAEHVEIASAPLVGQSRNANLRKIGMSDPIRVRRRQIVRLVREDEVEPVEAVASKHREVLIPVLA